MADGYAAIDEPSVADTDKKVDAEERVVNAVSVLLQRVRLAGAANRYADVNASNELTVADDYQAGECLDDQTGAGAVLTFTFAAPVSMVVVEAVGADQTARVDPFGGTPTATKGLRAGDAVPLYLPVVCTSVKVFAPSAMVVSLSGFRRS